MNKKMPFLSIVVPTYNEEENIAILYKLVLAAISAHVSKYEFIFVDDGSFDGTIPAVLSIRKSDPNVKLISLSRNFSHQIALTAGIDYAEGDAVLCMDADLQHPPEFIPEMIEAWRQGNDIVSTERLDNNRCISFKKLAATYFYFLMNRISSTSIDYNSADFRLLDRKIVDILKVIRERHRFLRGLINWVGFKKTKLRFKSGKRLHGKTKYSFIKMLQLSINGIISFSGVPLVLATFIGGLLATLSFLYGCFAIYQRFFLGNTPSGWASVLVSLLFLNGMIMLFLGIIGVYIIAIHDEVKKRPLYIIKESVGLSIKNNEIDYSRI